MARTNPLDHGKLRGMLKKRLRMRQNPFPEQRAATLDDLVFLPANLSRLVIDPYREACNVASVLAGKLSLSHPFMLTGFDSAPDEVRKHKKYLFIGLFYNFIKMDIPFQVTGKIQAQNFDTTA